MYGRSGTLITKCMEYERIIVGRRHAVPSQFTIFFWTVVAKVYATIGHWYYIHKLLGDEIGEALYLQSNTSPSQKDWLIGSNSRRPCPTKNAPNVTRTEDVAPPAQCQRYDIVQVWHVRYYRSIYEYLIYYCKINSVSIHCENSCCIEKIFCNLFMS